MTTSVSGLSIDCADPVAEAEFWSQVLHRPVNPGANAENAAIDATDPASGPRLAFHKVPEAKTVKNRLHLDLRTDEFEAESKRLTGLGAKPLWEIERPGVRWTTFADPEGNEFDLITSVPAPGGYVASPSERVRDWVARYEASGGVDGGSLNGLPVVILTTTGALSGFTRKTPIMRVERDGVYAAIASYSGNPRNPQWYYNLLAHPEAEVRDGASVHRVRARELSGAEKQRWWDFADALNPAYARYRADSGRDIPVLLLEPTDLPSPRFLGRGRPWRRGPRGRGGCHSGL
jgi:deazaflavin-dependent oxidoreductase (nitroreductase family)